MRNIRITVAAVAVAGVVACSQRSGEPQARIEQPIDGVDAAADVDAGPTCAHAICATGVPLQNTCDPCATQLCAQDPYCCTTTWDATCVGEVTSICNVSCTAPPPPDDGGTTACAHPICAAGVALASSCATCATQLCAQDPYCCSVAWDETCVAEVGSVCGVSCN